MLLNYAVGEDSWESLGLQGNPNQSILKEMSPEYSLEGLMLKVKLQYFGHLTWRTNSLEKAPDAGKDWKLEKGMTGDELVGGHHWLNGHEFEWALWVGNGRGSLACCSPCGRKVLTMTEQLNWTNHVQTNRSEATILRFLKRNLPSGKKLQKVN